MKPQIENLQKDSMHSFRVNHAKLPFLDSPWHYHPEYELLYIIRSGGQRIVGDSIDHFKEGDMVFVGPDLPHVWQNGDEYYQNDPNYKAEAIVVQFTESALGESFFQLPEMQPVRVLLKLSKRGLKIDGETHEKIARELRRITKVKGLKRITLLLKILDILSSSRDLSPLTTESFDKVYYDFGSERINKVFEFVANNFKKNILLDEVAEVASMSKTAFCRYFKLRSLKTFLEYLNEVRVNYACKLLIEGHMSISEISYECGFNSPSYFNRQFKAVKKLTPKEYTKKYKPVFIQ